MQENLNNWLLQQNDGWIGQQNSDDTNFDATKYQLGKLCPKAHDWNGTGKSLKLRSNHCCIQCQRERTNKSKMKRQETNLSTHSNVFNATAYYISNLCPDKHDWNDTGMSLYHKSDGLCSGCQVNNHNHYLGKLCPKGHNWNGTGQSLRTLSGRTCIDCSRERGRDDKANKRRKLQELRKTGVIPDRRKPALSAIRQAFEERGYRLLSQKYEDQNSKLDYICSQGHHYSTSWANFRAGNGCLYCAGSASPSYEDVKLAFEYRGFTLLAQEYKNAEHKLDFICSNGHHHSINWHSFKKGVGCAICSHTAKKLDFEVIKEAFKSRGCKLLTQEYLNTRQTLDCICSEGHEFSTTWSRFRLGSGCSTCAGIRRRKTYEEVKALFEARGYTLLTQPDKYERATDGKLDYICPQGHQHSITWGAFSMGQGCLYCSGRALNTIEYIREQFELKGYQLLTEYYENSYQKLEFICPDNHRWSMRWDHFQHRGVQCAVCAGNAKIDYQQVKDYIESSGYKLMTVESDYKNTVNKLTVLCPDGHTYKVSFKQFCHRDTRCRQCLIINNRGERHPRWNPNLTNEERVNNRMRLGEQAAWRIEVFRRDDRICQICGYKGDKINAHHLYSYNAYHSLRSDTDNGITLCEDCHIKFHKFYGYGNNTKEQFLEFINSTI